MARFFALSRSLWSPPACQFHASRSRNLRVILQMRSDLFGSREMKEISRLGLIRDQTPASRARRCDQFDCHVALIPRWRFVVICDGGWQRRSEMARNNACSLTQRRRRGCPLQDAGKTVACKKLSAGRAACFVDLQGPLLITQDSHPRWNQTTSTIRKRRIDLRSVLDEPVLPSPFFEHP